MGLVRFAASRCVAAIETITKSLDFSRVVRSRNRVLSTASSFKKMPLSVQKRLYRQVGIFACSLLVVMSFAPTDVSLGSFVYAPYTSYSVGEIVVADDEGYLTKLNPQTSDSDKSTMNDSLVHVVENGETLSAIAAKYDINVETIMWENDMYNANSLKLGQKLIIPPMDGVYHKVKEGDTLSKIATKYEVEGELIAKQNDITGDTVLSVGEELFVPGAKGVIPAAPEVHRNTIARTGSYSRGYVADTNLPNSSAQPVAGKTMIWPTAGKVTQGYTKYHHAIDIAKYPGGPIWAAADGVVVKASVGTWAGGYGNHVIIDHGNGKKTLYAHMEYENVKVGDHVTQGQVLGKMGRTGRVYGVTGIHLHFEVWQNGVKQNPWNYLK